MPFRRGVIGLVLAAMVLGLGSFGEVSAQQAKTKAQQKKANQRKEQQEALAKAEAEAAAKAKAEAAALASPALPPRKLPPPDSVTAITQKIDELIVAAMTKAEQSAGERCSDEEFLRRAYLDITGVIPKMKEAKAFLDSTAPDKRRQLIDDLLESPNYGRREADLWQAKLMPRDSMARFVQRDVFIDWLKDEFNSNTPWNELVSKIVTATGNVEENPAVTYFLVNRSVDKLTDSLGQHFLGLQISCAQCHNHPFTSWKQTDYWGLAEFYSKVNPANPKNPAKGGDNLKIGVQEGPNRTRLRDFFPESAKTVPPKFLGAEQPKLTPREPYRPTLAKWLTSPQNPYFAKAAVNRLWGQYFGRGIINPVDDLDGQDPSHPELLDYLSDQFAVNGFDQKMLIRAICNSAAYQRSSKPVKGSTTEEERELFARATVKVMTPEQLFDSLSLVTGADARPNANRPMGAQRGQANSPRDRFVQFFLAGAETPNTSEYEVGIPQALRLMNSRIIGNPAAIRSLVFPGSRPPQVIEAIWLAGLSRRPTEAELQTYLDYARKNGNNNEAYTDILWAVLNSSEFALIR